MTKMISNEKLTVVDVYEYVMDRAEDLRDTGREAEAIQMHLIGGFLERTGQAQVMGEDINVLVVKDEAAMRPMAGLWIDNEAGNYSANKMSAKDSDVTIVRAVLIEKTK